MKDMFQNRNFLRYFIADSLAKIADNYFYIFLTWLALQQTGSAAHAGALLMANAIPRLVLMLFGGSLADRVPPQVILRLGNVIQATGLGLILLWLLVGTIPLPGLFAVAIIFGAVDAFSAPASTSAIPRIVPRAQLLKANSLIQGTEMVSFISGALLAGAVLQLNNLEAATITNGVLYAGAALLFYTVKLTFHEESNKPTGSEFKQILAGLMYVWKKPVLRANTLLLAATNIAVSGPITIGMLLIVTQKLSLGPIFYTIVFAAFGVGALIGAVYAGSLKHVRGPGRILLASYLVTGVGFIGLAFIEHIWTIVICTLILGIVNGIASAINSTWVQLSTKVHMLGRVSAVTMLAALAFDPFSQGLAGIIAEWSIDGLFIISGLFILIATMIVAAFNRILFSNDVLPLHDSTDQH